MSLPAERNVDFGSVSVRTRISWGAIAAGAAVAMALYTLMMSLGIAVGMSVSEDVSSRSFGTGAGVWGFISLLIALFMGGWVTTQVTVGESRAEAILYGVVLWATTSVLLLWLAANGVRAGIDTAMAMRSTSNNNSASAVETDDTPEERQTDMQRAREVGREGAWWAFAGILLSMGASVAGALVGPVELTVRRDSRNFRDHHTTTT